jgi:hypothetical protein
MKSEQHCLVDTYYRIAPGRFHYLKFILEGYDNLAVLSMISSQSGVVRLKCSVESLAELLELLASVSQAVKRPSF